MTKRAAILEQFYQAKGGFLSAAQLCHLIHVSEQTVAAEIAELEKLGYKIESHPHWGYRLLSVPDRLTADDIKARLKPQVIGSEVIVFSETASTNDVVAFLGAAGGREGLVVFAESQTKGRGRRGRSWLSPRGKGLWFSVLLRPIFSPRAMSRITIAASVAIARAIRQTAALDARIKWPNDVTIGDRKVAGILTELQNNVAILGVGINVNCQREDFPPELAATATSIALETGHRQDRVALAAAALAALDDCYRCAQTDFDAVIAEWARWCSTIGRQISLKMGERRIEGLALALDSDGALLLRQDNGRVERILGADVTVEK